MTTDEYVEISEIRSKTIESVRIYKSTSEGTEMQIDLTDGTSFSCSFCMTPSYEARLIRRDSSLPQILYTYKLE